MTGIKVVVGWLPSYHSNRISEKEREMQCALCLKNKPLMSSHLLPAKFGSKHSFDAEHLLLFRSFSYNSTIRNAPH